MKINDLFNNNISNEIVSKYIKFYFEDLIGLRNKDIFFENIDNYYISIMKDDLERKNNGSGKLRVLPWSNFLFFFISSENAISLFGTNQKPKKFKGLNEDGEILLSNESLNSKTKNPNGLFYDNKSYYDFAKEIFNEIKNKEAYLFVRSYVYITIIIYDDGKVRKDNFFTYYYNTNYKFTQTNGKSNFISNVKNSYLVENVNFELENIKDSNKDILECVKAYNGSLEYEKLTQRNLDDIVALSKTEKFILVNGTARTGKTILAMSLLRMRPTSKLILMNYYFYKSLENGFHSLSIDFPKNRIFHQNSRKKEGYYDNNSETFDFTIVDECQRMGRRYHLLSKIIGNNHNVSIFFGDDNQRLNNYSDDGFNYIKETLNLEGYSFVELKFTESIGIPKRIIQNVRYLLGDDCVVTPCFKGEFEINIFDIKDEFLSSYANNKSKKHLATIQCNGNNFNSIGKYNAYHKYYKNEDFAYFLNDKVINKYYLSPYELISRELETIYVYIRKNIDVKDLKGFVFTQLFVLMTRGTISLNIYCENENLREYFETKYNEIVNFSNKIDKNIDNYINDEYFTVDEDHVAEFLERYEIDSPKETIKDRCITRLIHCTDESNIESIKKHGILPRTWLEEQNKEFTYNDEKRLDNRKYAVCLSIENPNHFLINKFKETYPNRHYKIIILNPSLLYCLFKNQDGKISLINRAYCDQNAAKRDASASPDDINIMFKDKMEIYFRKSNYSKTVQRTENAKKNLPTQEDAEIQFCGRIPPEFIESIEDY